jgi:L-ribulose-5-phosphate 4-epimerase
MDLKELAERLTVGCRILAEQEIIDAYGHLSARIPGDPDLFMMNRGMSPALVEPEDFIVMNLEGKVVSGKGFPNQEWPIHACIYRSRADVGSVLHSHSRLSRIFSLSQHKLRGLLTSSAPEWQGGLPVYREAGLITSYERGEALVQVLGDESAALLRGHGDVVVAGDPTATVMKAVTLKSNADVLHEAISHGGEIDLWTEEELPAWGVRRHASVPAEAHDSMSNRAWDYYEARINGRLDRLLHPKD